jgi:hypothetical protein
VSFQELKENLGLTTFQVEQLVAILRQKTAALLETYKQIAQKEAELYSLLTSGSQDLNHISKLTVDIHNLRTQVLPSDNQYRQRALAVLTPDQKNETGNSRTGTSPETAGVSGCHAEPHRWAASTNLAGARRSGRFCARRDVGISLAAICDSAIGRLVRDTLKERETKEAWT